MTGSSTSAPKEFIPVPKALCTLWRLHSLMSRRFNFFFTLFMVFVPSLKKHNSFSFGSWVSPFSMQSTKILAVAQPRLNDSRCSTTTTVYCVFEKYRTRMSSCFGRFIYFNRVIDVWPTKFLYHFLSEERTQCIRDDVGCLGPSARELFSNFRIWKHCREYLGCSFCVWKWHSFYISGHSKQSLRLGHIVT